MRCRLCGNIITFYLTPQYGCEMLYSIKPLPVSYNSKSANMQSRTSSETQETVRTCNGNENNWMEQLVKFAFCFFQSSSSCWSRWSQIRAVCGFGDLQLKRRLLKSKTFQIPNFVTRTLFSTCNVFYSNSWSYLSEKAVKKVKSFTYSTLYCIVLLCGFTSEIDNSTNGIFASAYNLLVYRRGKRKGISILTAASID